MNIIQFNSNKKVLVPITSKEQHLALIDSDRNKRLFVAAQGGDRGSKLRLAQINYVIYAKNGDLLREADAILPYFYQDFDFDGEDAEHNYNRVVNELLNNMERYQLMLLEKTATPYHLHAIFARPWGKTILECQYELALELGTEFDTNAHDPQRVLFSSPSENLLYVNPSIYDNTYDEKKCRKEYMMLKEKEAKHQENVPDYCHKGDKHCNPSKKKEMEAQVTNTISTEVVKPIATEHPSSDDTDWDQVRREMTVVANRVIEQGEDIAPSRNQHRDLAWSIQDAFGDSQDGYDIFLKLSRLWRGTCPQTEDDIKREWDAYLNSNKSINDHDSGMCYKHFFNMAKDIGIDISVSNNNMEKKQTNDSYLEELEASCLISVNTEFAEVSNIIEIDGVGCIARGDMAAIKAKPKNGKTNSIAIIIAAILKGQLFKIRCIEENASVIYFDTEQNPVDTQALNNRVLNMAEMPKQDIYSKLQVFTLRGVSMQERLSLIKHVLMKHKPTIAFIDGIVDLISDFNNLEQSSTIVNELATLAVQCNTAITTVLHTNKNIDDHNMRGHLGTILSQKISIEFECVKNGDTFVVKCSNSRRTPTPIWCWRFTEDGNIIQADDISEETHCNSRANRKKVSAINAETVRKKRENIVMESMESFTNGISRKELTELMKNKLQLGRSTISPLITSLIKSKQLVEQDEKLYKAAPIATDGDVAADGETGEISNESLSLHIFDSSEASDIMFPFE